MHPDLAVLAPTPAAPGADPRLEVAAITRDARSSFALGMKLLPRPGREAMRAVYAFARVIDDIADGPWPAAEKRRLLSDWRGEIDSVYRGEAISAIGLALQATVDRYALPRAEFLALIDGMGMDADGPIVAPPMAVLRIYSRRVAGSVGLIAMRIFGAWEGPVSERFALSLGDALQFTNILRDLGEDARLGRLYLPAELLAEQGIPPEPRAALAHPDLPLVCRRLAALARLEFEAARAAARAHRRLALTPALAMMGSYEVVLARLAARNFAPGSSIGRTRRLAGGLGRLARPGMRLSHV